MWLHANNIKRDCWLYVSLKIWSGTCQVCQTYVCVPLALQCNKLYLVLLSI